MGRKSSLAEKQWSEIGLRLLKGEAGRVLAREFGVSEAAIRKRFGAQTKQIKDVANQLVAAESAFSALPIGAQILEQDHMLYGRVANLDAVSTPYYETYAAPLQIEGI